MSRTKPRPAPPPLLTRSSLREDSSIEPAAFRPSFWPSTSSAEAYARLHQVSPPPVQLSPGLSPSVRSALPQPVPVRPSQPSPPRPAHAQSDLSVASTRAENEPLAVRDLRRVTAPPALMDPWVYDRAAQVARLSERPPKSPAVPGHRPRFVKSASATSLVTDRLSDVRGARRERWSVITDGPRDRDRDKKPPIRVAWFRAFRKRHSASDPDDPQHDDDPDDDDDQYGEYEGGGAFRLHRYGRLDRALGARGVDARVSVPDRLHDTPLGRVSSARAAVGKDFIRASDATGKDPADSLLSALTGDSDERERPRPRAMSESCVVQKRSSFVAGKEKVLGVWERLFRRSARRGARPPDRANGQTHRDGALRRSGKVTRLRSADRLPTRV